MLKRRKSTDDLHFFQNMGGHLAFADSCAHPRKFESYGVNFIDYGICLQACKNTGTCRIYWNRKNRIEKAREICCTFVDLSRVKEELNGKV